MYLYLLIIKVFLTVDARVCANYMMCMNAKQYANNTIYLFYMEALTVVADLFGDIHVNSCNLQTEPVLLGKLHLFEVVI